MLFVNQLNWARQTQKQMNARNLLSALPTAHLGEWQKPGQYCRDSTVTGRHKVSLSCQRSCSSSLFHSEVNDCKVLKS